LRIQRVCVVGAGLMGTGIATVCLKSGYSVVLVDVNDAILTKSQEQIFAAIDKWPESDGQKQLERKAAISFSSQLDTALRSAIHHSIQSQSQLLIIEAIVENLTAKQALMQKMEKLINDSTELYLKEHEERGQQPPAAPLSPSPGPYPIFATNTSSLLVRDIGSATTLSPRFYANFGALHFFSPVPVMPLVEVVATDNTSQETLATLLAFVKSIGKTPLVCKDSPGFVVNRILVPMLVEALGLVDRGVASPADIDLGCVKGAGLPIGPFRLADFIGLDIFQNIIKGWTEHYPTEFPMLTRSRALDTLVAGGKLGRKTGEGFYKYTPVTTRPPSSSASSKATGAAKSKL